MDEAVEELVCHDFSSDPEEMVYRCGELNEFWKVRVRGSDGVRASQCGEMW